MDEFGEIRNAIESTESNDDVTSDYTNVSGRDPVESLSIRLSNAMSEMGRMDERIKRLESVIVGLTETRDKTETKPRISVPVQEYFGSKPPPSVVGSINSKDEDRRSRTPGTSRATSISIAESERESLPPPSKINPFASSYASPNQTISPQIIISKSSSATAPMGYGNKASVWGTALASMLISAMKFYITKTNAQGLTIDDVHAMSNCIALVPTMYSNAMHKELPSVKMETTKYLSSAISRRTSTEVPVSYAEDWVSMENNATGKDVIMILNTIVKIAKMVPEAVVHPLSCVVRMLVPPVARVLDGEIKYAMISNVEANPIPNQWERFCMILKNAALVKYVSYRLTGMSESAVFAKMLTEMRDNDMVDKKNMEKLRELRPYPMNIN